VGSLELTAAEMAQAAADLVAREREILDLRDKVSLFMCWGTGCM